MLSVFYVPWKSQGPTSDNVEAEYIGSSLQIRNPCVVYSLLTSVLCVIKTQSQVVFLESWGGGVRSV